MKPYIIRRSLLDGFCFSVICSAFYFYLPEAVLNTEMNFKLQIILFLCELILGALLSSVLYRGRITTLGAKIFQPDFNPGVAEAKNFYRTFWGWQFLVTLLILFIIGIFKTRFSFFELLNIDGLQGAQRLFLGMASPNWQVLPQAISNIIETIFMAFIATTLATPVAFVLSFLAAKNVMKGRMAFIIYLFLRTILNLVRSIEALVWAIIFSVWVGIGPFAGMLALMMHSIASLTKQYSEIVESVNEGPIEGIQSCGANKIQTIWYAIVPQVILPFISFTVYRWDINVRMATIIGLVGGGGIGTMLIKYQGQAMWAEVGTIIFVIAVVVWLMDQASAVLREALK
ncbi:MAG: phosphonate ABC transporter, permease protein PhnE [Bdellovibrionaceae bacterium]|nr:phosphonate ABC transporter, permease protein PhnE [Bdellovibrio sp.]